MNLRSSSSNSLPASRPSRELLASTRSSMLSHKSSAAPSYGGSRHLRASTAGSTRGGGSSEGPDHRQLGSGPPSFPATALHECNRGILAGRPARLNDAYAALFDGLCDGLTDWVQSGPRRSASNGPPLSPASASPHSSAKGHGHTVPRARNGHVRRKVHRVMSWDNPTIPTLFTHTDPEVGSFGFCASPYSRTSDRLVSRRTSTSSSSDMIVLSFSSSSTSS